MVRNLGDVLSLQDSPVMQANPVECPAVHGHSVLQGRGQGPRIPTTTLRLARFARLRTMAVPAAEAMRIQHQIPRAASQHAPLCELPTQPRIGPLHLLTPRSCARVAPQNVPSGPSCSLPAAPAARPAPPPASAPGRGARARGAGLGLPARAPAAWRAAPEAPAAQPVPPAAARPPCGGPSPRAPGRSAPTSLRRRPLNHRAARPRRVSPPPAAGRLGGVGPIAGRRGRRLRRPRSQRPPPARPVGPPRPSPAQPLRPWDLCLLLTEGQSPPQRARGELGHGKRRILLGFLSKKQKQKQITLQKPHFCLQAH